MFKITKISWIISVVITLTSGCATRDFTNLATTLKQAEQQSLKRETHQTNTFKLTTFSRANKPHQPLVVYFEGDGHSLKSRYQLSDNPTPHQPLALQLATLDTRSNIIYIARPCQYTPIHEDKLCDAKYWSTHRFAPEVLHATNEVINKFAKQLQSKEVILIGFSGGGSVATLIAALRQDVTNITTIAGDLNHYKMAAYHQTSKLNGSLCPVDIADKIAHIPQIHYVGNQDKIVPVQIAKSFKAASLNSPCVHIETLNNTHHQGWATVWPELIKKEITCG